MSGPRSIRNRKGVVIFLDVLGSKAVADPAKAISEREDFIRYANERWVAFDHLAEHFKSIGINTTKFYSFSDTIIIAMAKQDDTVDVGMIRDIGSSIGAIEREAMERGIPYRGAVSVGSFAASDSMILILGEAVKEAAEYYELPNWIGISTAPSVSMMFREMSDEEVENVGFIRYDIPLKNGIEKNGYALAWPTMGPTANQNPSLIYPRLKDELKELGRISSDLSVKFKARNTLDFIDYVFRETKMGKDWIRRNHPDPIP